MSALAQIWTIWKTYSDSCCSFKDSASVFKSEMKMKMRMRMKKTNMW